MSQIDPASFLYGPNGAFVAELYSRYLEDPNAVDESWRSFFAELRDEPRAAIEAELEGPSWAPRAPRLIGNGHAEGKPNGGNGQAAAAVVSTAVATVAEVQQAALDSIRALMLI